MEIGELALDIWRLYMLENLALELVRHILEGIAADRASNGALDSHRVEVIHGVIHSFVEVQEYKKTGSLKLYQELFEGPMLEASGAYYTNEANKLLQRCSVSQYMQEVIKILEYESRRAQNSCTKARCPSCVNSVRRSLSMIAWASSIRSAVIWYRMSDVRISATCISCSSPYPTI